MGGYDSSKNIFEVKDCRGFSISCSEQNWYGKILGSRPLVKTNQLKTNYLTNYHQNKIFFHYDDLSDTFMLLFISPDRETIVHYLDKYVAILYTPEDYEIVGLQVDYFQSDFIPMYEDLQKEWCLSNFVVKNESFWDLTLNVESKKVSIALEIIKAKHNIIGKSADKFKIALAYS